MSLKAHIKSQEAYFEEGLVHLRKIVGSVPREEIAEGLFDTVMNRFDEGALAVLVAVATLRVLDEEETNRTLAAERDEARAEVVRLGKEDEEHRRMIRAWHAAREADEVEFEAWLKRVNDGVHAALAELTTDEQVEERIEKIKQTARERIEARRLRGALDEERIEPRPSVHSPIMKSYAIDQITDIERLRAVAHHMWEAFAACHEQCAHIIGALIGNSGCEQCARALLEDGQPCDRYAEWLKKITDGFGSV